jgi:DNA-binding CsgD family transcriptional regulator
LRANGCTAVLDYLGLIAALQMFLERLSARNSREAEVLQWVAEGQTNNQSGETLGIRLKTSKNTGSP